MTAKTAGDLADAPYNPRIITETEEDILARTLAEFGDLSGVVYNVKTGHLIGGHQRKKVYLADYPIKKKKHTDETGTVALGYIDTPKGRFHYREVDWPEDKEIQANLAANKAGGKFDYGAVMDLLEHIDNGENDLELTGFSLEEIENLIHWQPPEDPESDEIPDELFDDDDDGLGGGDDPDEVEMPLLNTGDVPDALFPTDNEMEIPQLVIGLQADFLDIPMKQWGSVSKRAKDKLMRGTWHFYTDDYKFNALWQKPHQLVNTRCPTAIEPNFSTGDQTPLAMGLYQIYRKRWIARYWQQYGVKILVDLNVNEKFYEYNLMGVPEGWRAYATRGYADRLSFMDAELKMAQERAGTDDLLFVVYGGRKAVKEWCMENQAIWIPEHMSVFGEDGKDNQGMHLIEGKYQALEEGDED